MKAQTLKAPLLPAKTFRIFENDSDRVSGGGAFRYADQNFTFSIDFLPVMKIRYLSLAFCLFFHAQYCIGQTDPDLINKIWIPVSCSDASDPSMDCGIRMSPRV